MRRFSGNVWIFFAILLVSALDVGGADIFPLEPPDTSSPRATLTSFFLYSDAFAQAMHTSNNISPDAQALLERAIQCLDLSEVPPNIVKDVALESVLRLREILDRVPLPDSVDIPDKHDSQRQNLAKWRVPHTELVIAKVTKGVRADEFLFSPETVLQLETYYQKIKGLPYREGAVRGIYEKYIFSPGWMIPSGLINALPGWMKSGYFEQAVWQWIGLVLAIGSGGLLFVVLLRWHARLKARWSGRAWQVHLLICPLSAIGLCLFWEYFIDDQINITGLVMKNVIMAFEFIYYCLMAWAVLVSGDLLMHGIIACRKIREEALDADVVRLVCRLLSFVFVFAVFYRAGVYFGLPVSAIFTSAGIAGVAVALAARETLSNFFGGVSIFLDRPFRTGDFIVLDTGERGEVKAVGMRSTRIQTRDDILITIPNSVITNVKIVNQSMPHPHFRVRIKIDVGYGSNLDQVEKIFLAVARENKLVMDDPEPRVRLRGFGESGINFELLVWVVRPHDQGLLTHQLSKAIYSRFRKDGIEIPYPQLDIHFRPDKRGAA